MFKDNFKKIIYLQVSKRERLPTAAHLGNLSYFKHKIGLFNYMRPIFTIMRLYISLIIAIAS